MQWSLDWKIESIIAGRSGAMRYPGSRGRHREHFVFLYTNTYEARFEKEGYEGQCVGRGRSCHLRICEVCDQSDYLMCVTAKKKESSMTPCYSYFLTSKLQSRAKLWNSCRRAGNSEVEATIHTLPCLGCPHLPSTICYYNTCSCECQAIDLHLAKRSLNSSPSQRLELALSINQLLNHAIPGTYSMEALQHTRKGSVCGQIAQATRHALHELNLQVLSSIQ